VEASGPDFFTAIAPDRRVRVAVNALDAAVTAINRTALANAPPAAASIGAQSRLPAPWLGLLMLAAALMLVEWWTYNRRLTV
jgi:hypothetical protein